jgi:hypothetical protein
MKEQSEGKHREIIAYLILNRQLTIARLLAVVRNPTAPAQA